MATYAVSAKGKDIITYEGFDYMLKSAKTRKDGSELWHCTDRDCEGRLLKKTVDNSETFELTKEHSKQLPTVTSVALHLCLNSLKERAISHPSENPKDTIKFAMDSIKDYLIASMPSASKLEECITKWRKDAMSMNGGATPNTKENRPRAKPSSTRKRIKLNSTNGDTKTDGEDSPLRPLKPLSTTPKVKRSRSISVANDDNDDDDDLV